MNFHFPHSWAWAGLGPWDGKKATSGFRRDSQPTTCNENEGLRPAGCVCAWEDAGKKKSSGRSFVAACRRSILQKNEEVIQLFLFEIYYFRNSSAVCCVVWFLVE